MNAITPRLDIKGLIRAVRTATGQERGTIPLLRATLTERDRLEILAALNRDPFGYESIKAFELAIAEVTGRTFAVAVSSGTAALHLSLAGLNIGPGDEVIVPALTFAAAAAAVTYCGALPHFVDCHFSPFGAINVFKLRQHLCRLPAPALKKIKAIIAVDLFGHPGVKPELVALAREFNLPLIEDAAAALGSEGNRNKCGSNGIASIISFNCNKIVTTGGGGMLLTDDEVLAARARHLATTAKEPSPWHYRHDLVGFNYRMPNLCAAVGLSQLRRLPKLIEAKRNLRDRYRAALLGSSFELVDEADGCQSNAWLNAVMLSSNFNYHAETHRDETLRKLQEAGIDSRSVFKPLNLLPPYQNCPAQADLGVARDIHRRTIGLPSSVQVAA